MDRARGEFLSRSGFPLSSTAASNLAICFSVESSCWNEGDSPSMDHLTAAASRRLHERLVDEAAG